MSPATADPAPFRAFEAAGWAARADAYHRFFRPISARLVGPLLDAAQVGPHTRVLDLGGRAPRYQRAIATSPSTPVWDRRSRCSVIGQRWSGSDRSGRG